MHYLVDAYNLLFRTVTKRQSLEKARKDVIEAFNGIAITAHLSITLVFDGADEDLVYSSRKQLGAIECVYTTKDRSADTYILEEVMHAKCRDQITVVTNDRELSRLCSYWKAKTLTIDAFITLVAKRKSAKKKQVVGRKTLSYESSREFARLLAIFEQKLSEEE